MQQSRFPLLFVQMKRLALQLFIPPFYLPRQSLTVSQKTHRELGGGLKILSFGFSFSLPLDHPGNLASTHHAADLGKIAPLIGHGFSEEYEHHWSIRFEDDSRKQKFRLQNCCEFRGAVPRLRGRLSSLCR